MGKRNEKREWKEYRVNSSNRRLFDAVYHVSHISPSITIIKDGMIKAGLVYDESILNTKRIAVAWLSPNEWIYGYRYGNVRFNFPWNQIIKRAKYYWVEVITRYRPPACRILITLNNYDDLQEYDPQIGDGPWVYDKASKEHYFNGDYCIEFMVEDDLILSGNITIDFVNHHREYCSINRLAPLTCPEIGMYSREAATLFIINVIAQAVKVDRKQLVNDEEEVDVPDIFGLAGRYFHDYLTAKEEMDYSGTIRYRDTAAIPLARAICNAFANPATNDEFCRLSSLFRSEDDFLKSVTKASAYYFGGSDWRAIFRKIC